MSARRLAALCALISLATSETSSQVIGLASSLAGARAAPNACSATSSYAALSTEAIADWAFARVTWSGTVASSLTGSAAQHSTLGAQLYSPEWRGWRVSASGARDFGAAPCATTSAVRQHGAGLSYTWRRSGVSLRYVTRLTRNAGASAADTMVQRMLGPTTRGVALAAWRHAGRALVSVSLGSRSRWREERTIVPVIGVPDTLPTDSGSVIIPAGPRYEPRTNRGLVHAFGSEIGMAWSNGRVTFDALAGGALGARRLNGARLWGRSDASIALTPSFAVIGAFVLDDGWDNQRLMPRRYFTLGARLTSAPFSRPVKNVGETARSVAGAFRFETSQTGVVTLGVLAANARLVELTGDFVQWRPVKMQRVSADWWELRLSIAPGVHRMNVRIDGGSWRAPPGLERQRDEFGGDAGVLVIP